MNTDGCGLSASSANAEPAEPRRMQATDSEMPQVAAGIRPDPARQRDV